MNSGREVLFLLAAVWGALALLPFSTAADTPGGNDGRRDLHSFGRPEQVVVTHVSLDLAVDFDKKVLKGEAVLSFRRRPGSPPDAPLVLDTRGLEIEGVSLARPGREKPHWALKFSLGEEDKVLGRPLTIDVPAGVEAVRVEYQTTDRSRALQWVGANGTAGGKHPFLFTQSQAIQARSWVPLQDSPAVRVTYDARIHAPHPLTPVMSAESASGDDRFDGSGGTSFEMTRPIPPYLIALAVGELSWRKLGPRTAVAAEPTVVDSAAREFVDTEKMIDATESRYGPYRWGKYSLLVLPPSFPFGGMENACLTFVTPTVLAGDRSLVSLIAHELAHSWSGNLVTNATWRDFWLNEGFTTYIERRVTEDLYGPERAAMERVLGVAHLREELADLAPRDQVLHIDLTGRDPDDGMNGVPYEKGALFLTALEEAFGRPAFDAFLRSYFDHFAFQSITTDEFVAYLRTTLLSRDQTAARKIDLHAWLEEPGLPADAPEPKSERLARVAIEARDWAEGKVPATDIVTADWSTFEWLQFLRSLPDRVGPDRLADLDRAFGLTARGNAEVAHLWLIIAARNRYAPADARLERFLTTIGRRKYLMPLYTELLKTPEGAARARAIYARARPFYHPIAVESVDKLLAEKPE